MSRLDDAASNHPAEARIELLHTPGCPHLDQTRSLLGSCLTELQLETTVVDREGDYPSPTILVDGVDVMGRSDLQGAMCRLDPPARERILAALTR